MNFRINWGWSILIAIILFISFMLTLVYRTTLEDNSLVSEDYYEQSFKQNEKLQKIENTNLLSEKVIIDKDDENVIILFPEVFEDQKLSGTIYFYHPSLKKFDRKIEIKVNQDNQVFFPLNKLHKGKYIVKIDYLYNNTPYFQEETVFINMDF